MTTAAANSRTFYLDDFADEIMPCDGSLDGWATWLATPLEPDEDGETDFGREGIVSDGADFSGSAILWGEDIIASRTSKGWRFSRQPGEDDFLAVRFGPGAGWQGDNIITQEIDFANCGTSESMAEAMSRWFEENDDACDDVEHIACGKSEEGWRFTYQAEPPSLQAERGQ